MERRNNMDWWTQLVNSIADTFYPERVTIRKAEEEKIVVKALEEGEVKLEKFSEQASIIKEKPKLKTVKPKRARTAKGHYKGDDKTTTNINEAWVGGKKPKSKKARKKKKKK
tara:strand:- start:1886 stop:2221 length:336 start_codon:yes stop_codon:yes gene_type:complete